MMLPVYLLLKQARMAIRRLCISGTSASSSLNASTGIVEAISGTASMTKAIDGAVGLLSGVSGVRAVLARLNCTRYNQGCD